MSRLAIAEIERVFRQEYGRAVAVLVRVLGTIDAAEEAVQDAFTAAVERWPSAGLPPSPAGWIITTARHRAIDRLRREASREHRLDDCGRDAGQNIALDKRERARRLERSASSRRAAVFCRAARCAALGVVRTMSAASLAARITECAASSHEGTHIAHQGRNIMFKNILTMATMLTLVAAIAAAAPSSTPSAPSAASEGPAVTEVIVFDVGPNMDKFLELTKRAGSIAQKYGSTGKARFWRAAYAGREAGAVIVTVEYPSLVSMAQSVSKVQPSPEWQQLVADGQASSIKPISQSVVVEVKAGS